jgi:hypothetical protein
VADDQGGLQIIDVSDPANPAIVGEETTINQAFDVFVSGSVAYLVGSSFYIIDVSDPANPSLMANLGTGSMGVTVLGDRAYLAGSGKGLKVVDVSDPYNPSLLGIVNTPGSARDVEVIGMTAYVADEGGGLQIIDVSDPAVQTVISQLDIPTTYEVVVRDSLVYAGTYRGLRIVDVREPENPYITGEIDDLLFSLQGIDLVGNRAYATSGEYGIKVIDVSEPSNPTVIGSVDTPGHSKKIKVVGTTAYVADDNSLQLIDVSDPQVMTNIGSVVLPERVLDVDIDDALAYVANHNNGLQIVDVNPDPLNPTYLSVIETIVTPGSCWAVSVAGTLAYVVDWYSLEVIEKLSTSILRAGLTGKVLSRWRCRWGPKI